MNTVKKHHIECCDSWSRVEGLPTYTELVAALIHAKEVIEVAPMPYTSPATLAEIDAILAKLEGIA